MAEEEKENTAKMSLLEMIGRNMSSEKEPTLIPENNENSSDSGRSRSFSDANSSSEESSC